MSAEKAHVIFSQILYVVAEPPHIGTTTQKLINWGKIIIIIIIIIIIFGKRHIQYVYLLKPLWCSLPLHHQSVPKLSPYSTLLNKYSEKQLSWHLRHNK